SLEYQDVVLRDIIIDNNVTGILGEEVHLHCLYSGIHNISFSSWSRLSSETRLWAMAGYKNGKPFTKDNFFIPASHTNLTVKVNINSLEVEGNYACVFRTEDDEEFRDKLLLKVIARPYVNTHAEEEVLNGTHYQNINCSASYAKPSATLHWDIHGAPPRNDIFSIHNTHSTLPNGTVSIVSMLRFPIHRNNESSVACVVQHPALPDPITTIINLQTFVSPNVTLEMAVTENEGKAFFKVLCKAKGGRPHPSITWIKPKSADKPCSAHFMNFESVSSSYCFPLDVYEGENITCIFSYPHLSAIEKTITLPTYYLTSLQLTNSSIKGKHLNTFDLLIFDEEDSDIRIGMEVLGHVPQYEINCTKDGKPLSEDINVVVSDLIIKGPVETNHSGQYQCQASYYSHSASLRFEIEVKPRFKLPALLHMTLLSNVTWDNGIKYTEVKCMAENVSPDVNITWHTVDCRSGIDASEPGKVVSGSHQDLGVIWKMARIPVYSYAGCKLICVMHHPALEKPMQKCIQIPFIEPPSRYVSVALQKDSTHWAAVCKCKSDEAMINISWVISDTNKTAQPSSKNTTTEGWRRVVMSIYKFDLSQHEGKLLTCVIQSEFGEVERRTIRVPGFFISSIVVLNKTLPLHRSHGEKTGLHRVVLKEHVSNQKIIFKVNGNASAYDIKCFRSNGLSAHTVGMALVFAQQVSESDAGLYTCSASWYHHNATVTVLVDIISQEIHSMMLILICFSSAVAITIIMVVTLCIFCKRSEETHSSTQ
ncbi:poliovirus receptor-like, partial [Clarias magur]